MFFLLRMFHLYNVSREDVLRRSNKLITSGTLANLSDQRPRPLWRGMPDNHLYNQAKVELRLHSTQFFSNYIPLVAQSVLLSLLPTSHCWPTLIHCQFVDRFLHCLTMRANVITTFINVVAGTAVSRFKFDRHKLVHFCTGCEMNSLSLKHYLISPVINSGTNQTLLHYWTPLQMDNCTMLHICSSPPVPTLQSSFSKLSLFIND